VHFRLLQRKLGSIDKIVSLGTLLVQSELKQLIVSWETGL
jgi:hypothetical protein